MARTQNFNLISQITIIIVSFVVEDTKKTQEKHKKVPSLPTFAVCENCEELKNVYRLQSNNLLYCNTCRQYISRQNGSLSSRQPPVDMKSYFTESEIAKILLDLPTEVDVSVRVTVITSDRVKHENVLITRLSREGANISIHLAGCSVDRCNVPFATGSKATAVIVWMFDVTPPGRAPLPVKRSPDDRSTKTSQAKVRKTCSDEDIAKHLSSPMFEDIFNRYDPHGETVTKDTNPAPVAVSRRHLEHLLSIAKETPDEDDGEVDLEQHEREDDEEDEEGSEEEEDEEDEEDDDEEEVEEHEETNKSS